MAIFFRFAAAFAVAVLTQSTVAAQVPIAPPPHPSLDEMVEEYRRFGLPIAPKEAELVKIKWWSREGSTEDTYFLAFRIPPMKPKGEPQYLMVDGTIWRHGMDDREITLAKPILETLHQVESYLTSDLWLAVECRIHGWDGLASALYRRVVNDWMVEKKREPFFSQLRHMAWNYWEDQLTDRTRGRKIVVQYLKMLVEEDESPLTARRGYILSGAEATIEPRRSKPGSAESLIDDLTDYWKDYSERNRWNRAAGSRNFAGQEAYWKLVDLGFDAVPALIEHLNDDRFSRAMSEGAFNNFRNYNLTVGHLASMILFDLSARKVDEGYWALRGDRIDPDKARKWFAEAEKIGEEKWLLDHSVPKDDGGSIVNQRGRPENQIVRVIGIKYPQKLPPIYRAILKKPASAWLEDYIAEIATSKLSREQKVALLEEGAFSDDRLHRLNALDGIAQLDPVALRKPLVASLKRIRPENWLLNPERVYWFQLVQLTETANDSACWNALAAAGKNVGVGSRLDLIGRVCPDRPVDREDSQRLARIRFLMEYLDDRTPEICAAWDGVEVRDHAASKLAGLLGLSWARPIGHCTHPGETRGAIARLIVRAMVGQAAVQELERLKKQP